MRRSLKLLVVSVGLVQGCDTAPVEPGATPTPPPAIEQRPTTSAPNVPAGFKVTCLSDPNAATASPTCPVVVWGTKVYWAYTALDNSTNMRMVAYQGTTEVGTLDRSGARYLYRMSVNATDSTVTIVGQASNTIVVRWSDLP